MLIVNNLTLDEITTMEGMVGDLVTLRDNYDGIVESLAVLKESDESGYPLCFSTDSEEGSEQVGVFQPSTHCLEALIQALEEERDITLKEIRRIGRAGNDKNSQDECSGSEGTD
jgi:hypothetical protein